MSSDTEAGRGDVREPNVELGKFDELASEYSDRLPAEYIQTVRELLINPTGGVPDKGYNLAIVTTATHNELRDYDPDDFSSFIAKAGAILDLFDDAYSDGLFNTSGVDPELAVNNIDNAVKRSAVEMGGEFAFLIMMISESGESLKARTLERIAGVKESDDTEVKDMLLAAALAKISEFRDALSGSEESMIREYLETPAEEAE
ncbi:hypothetical protein HQ524_01810 [Candidatus Uhrbacteria bacterium]|nr:hypothetical protein [Candidatus Uhrbacteria bacterium]